MKTIRESKDARYRSRAIADEEIRSCQKSSPNAILEMRLYQLTGLERDKIEAEYLEIIKLINYLRDLLSNDRQVYGVIKTDLLEMRKLYADERRTQIVPDEGESTSKISSPTRAALLRLRIAATSNACP